MSDLRRKGLKIAGCFDIETASWSQFVMGGLIYRDELRIYSWEHEEEFASALLNCEGDIWTFNGGRFDVLWLLEHVVRRGLRSSIALAGSSIVSLRIGPQPGRGNAKTVTFKDAARLVGPGFDLNRFASLAGNAKIVTGLPCDCGQECGGYCAISRTMAPEPRRKLRDYLEVDLRATIEGLEWLETWAAANDIDLCGTVGSSAWRTAMRTLGLPAADWGNALSLSAGALYQRVRNGYYGGHPDVYQTRAASGWHYDLNSAYPAALRDLALPWGKYREYDNARAEYDRGREGVLRARVRVPDSHIPSLPVRLPGPRVGYPTGEFCGTWTANELRYAESVGVRIQELGSGIFWETSQRVFGPFCERIFRLRAEAGSKSPLGAFLKNLPNSMAGKTAQHPERDALATGIDGDEIFCQERRPCIGDICRAAASPKCCIHRCIGACGRWEPLGLGMRFFKRTIISFAPSAHVQWAAYMTAHTRCELHRMLLGDDEGQSAVYCDTDSVFSTSERDRNLGNDLGQWKLEDRFRRFKALAPKTYTYEPLEWHPPLTDWREARAKGITDAAGNWEAIEAGDTVTMDRGVEGLRTAIRQGGPLFTRRRLSRSVIPDKQWVGARVRLPGHKTRPPTIDEARARE